MFHLLCCSFQHMAEAGIPNEIEETAYDKALAHHDWQLPYNRTCNERGLEESLTMFLSESSLTLANLDSVHILFTVLCFLSLLIYARELSQSFTSLSNFKRPLFVKATVTCK